MKRNRSLFLLLVFCFLSLASSEEGVAGTLQDIRTRGKLIVGVKADYPPFGFLDENGAHKGFDIDIAEALSRELFGKKGAVEFVNVTSGNRIAFLNSGKIDVIVATLTITEKRKKIVDFSIPYFITAERILVRADSEITKYQDLAEKKVATIRGSTGDIAIEELVPTAERVRFERNSEALQALKEGRVEAFVQDFVLLHALVQKTRGLKMGGLEPIRPARCGLAVRKGENECRDFIDATLTKMKGTGEYQRLLDKWFGPLARVLWMLLESQK